MLVTFSSDAYENITFFGDVAKHLLTLMGHSGTIPSALMPEDIPEALAKLEHSLNPNKNQNQSTPDDEELPISLAHRAWPLINMLKAAQTKNCNIRWS